MTSTARGGHGTGAFKPSFHDASCSPFSICSHQGTANLPPPPPPTTTTTTNTASDCDSRRSSGFSSSVRSSSVYSSGSCLSLASPRTSSSGGLPVDGAGGDRSLSSCSISSSVAAHLERLHSRAVESQDLVAVQGTAAGVAAHHLQHHHHRRHSHVTPQYGMSGGGVAAAAAAVANNYAGPRRSLDQHYHHQSAPNRHRVAGQDDVAQPFVRASSQRVSYRHEAQQQFERAAGGDSRRLGAAPPPPRRASDPVRTLDRNFGVHGSAQHCGGFSNDGVGGGNFQFARRPPGVAAVSGADVLFSSSSLSSGYPGSAASSLTITAASPVPSLSAAGPAGCHLPHHAQQQQQMDAVLVQQQQQQRVSRVPVVVP